MSGLFNVYFIKYSDDQYEQFLFSFKLYIASNNFPYSFLNKQITNQRLKKADSRILGLSTISNSKLKPQGDFKYRTNFCEENSSKIPLNSLTPLFRRQSSQQMNEYNNSFEEKSNLEDSKKYNLGIRADYEKFEQESKISCYENHEGIPIEYATKSRNRATGRNNNRRKRTKYPSNVLNPCYTSNSQNVQSTYNTLNVNKIHAKPQNFGGYISSHSRNLAVNHHLKDSINNTYTNFNSKTSKWNQQVSSKNSKRYNHRDLKSQKKVTKKNIKETHFRKNSEQLFSTLRENSKYGNSRRDKHRSVNKRNLNIGILGKEKRQKERAYNW